MDIGCGAGLNMDFLKRWGDVVGIDQSEVALSLARQYGAVEKGDALNLPRPDEVIDLITAFDVLEHLPDDGKALREWYRVLKSGGYVAISVPAYQWLYGPHDKILLHKRRYTLGELSLKLSRAGFQTIFASYVFMFTFPVFLVQRLLTKSLNRGAGYNSAPPIINQILIGLGRLEAMLIKSIKLPFGSSVFILARKI
ncbi:class I SAM-dependent methyltransferase [Patescibacteria group bacterium]|nr:class I SAM-dependent methyltransferase [Patescibacteria group bacterium]